MRLIRTIMILLLLSAPALAADQRVRGYWRDSDGDGYRERYVQPYHRSTPDSSTYNNYSTLGNVNPWTDSPGSVQPSNPYSSRNPYLLTPPAQSSPYDYQLTPRRR